MLYLHSIQHNIKINGASVELLVNWTSVTDDTMYYHCKTIGQCRIQIIQNLHISSCNCDSTLYMDNGT